MLDLEIVLNKVSSEYPAIVREVLLSNYKNELGEKCASISSDGWCWMVHNKHLYAWKLNQVDRAQESQVYKLQLAPSGLPYTSDTVLLYDRGTGLPGGITVSGEGVVRHWTRLGGTCFDTPLDLSNEVTLSLHILFPFKEYVVVLLTTTSGSLYRLETEVSRDTVTCTRLGSIEQKTVSKRFSSFLFGNSTAPTNFGVVRSLVLQERNNESSPLVCVLSTSAISIFHSLNKTVLWTGVIQSLLSDLPNCKFQEIGVSFVENTRYWILDGLQFRRGLILLLAIAPNVDRVHLALGEAFLFLVKSRDEGSFVGRFHLGMAASVAKSPSMLHSNGLAVIHSTAIQCVLLPDDLKGNSELVLNLSLPLLSEDPLLGFGNDEYSYIIRVTAGIQTIRLLPKGFQEEMMPEGGEEALADRLSPDGEDTPQMTILKKALCHFSNKKIMEASRIFENLLQTERLELQRLVYSFLMDLIDSEVYGVQSSTVDLLQKKVLFRRVILFLKTMHVFEQVCEKSCLHRSDVGLTQLIPTGTLLQEVSERIEVAISLCNLHTSSERKLLNEVAASFCGSGSSETFETTWAGKLSSLHTFFPMLYEHVSIRIKVSTVKQRIHLLFTASRILIEAANSIDKCRRIPIAPQCYDSDSGKEKNSRWTHGEVTKSYIRMAFLMCDELEGESDELTTATRSSLKELITSIAVFALPERQEKLDGEPLLVRLSKMGEESLALELAEKFKDFKILAKVTLNMAENDRRRHIDNYKRTFERDNFDVYICQFYLKNNLTEELLEQRGERVEQFMLQHGNVRWRRQLQQEKYDEAAHSLLSAADKENAKVTKKKGLLALSYIAACCADEVDKSVKDVAQAQLTLIAHQEKIPSDKMVEIYGCSLTPLTLEEIVDLNTLVSEDRKEKIPGYLRALHAVAAVLVQGGEGKEKAYELLLLVWKRILSETFAVGNISEDYMELCVFALVTGGIYYNEDWSRMEKNAAIPEETDIVSFVDEANYELVKSSFAKLRLLVI